MAVTVRTDPPFRPLREAFAKIGETSDRIIDVQATCPLERNLAVFNAAFFEYFYQLFEFGMGTIRSKYGRLTHIACFVFALHILNMSIDPKDPKPDSIPEDLTINDIESIAEFFAEVVFGIKNAFAEHDEHDNDEGRTVDICKVFFVTQQAAHSVNAEFIPFRAPFFIYSDKAATQPVRDIAPPPPKA